MLHILATGGTSFGGTDSSRVLIDSEACSEGFINGLTAERGRKSSVQRQIAISMIVSHSKILMD